MDEILRANEEENTETIDPMIGKIKVQLDQIRKDLLDLGKKRASLVVVKNADRPASDVNAPSSPVTIRQPPKEAVDAYEE